MLYKRITHVPSSDITKGFLYDHELMMEGKKTPSDKGGKYATVKQNKTTSKVKDERETDSEPEHSNGNKRKRDTHKAHSATSPRRKADNTKQKEAKKDVSEEKNGEESRKKQEQDDTEQKQRDKGKEKLIKNNKSETGCDGGGDKNNQIGNGVAESRIDSEESEGGGKGLEHKESEANMPDVAPLLMDRLEGGMPEDKERRPSVLTKEQLALYEKEMSKEFFLDSILKDTRAREVFAGFCEKNYCSESILFWMDVEAFRGLEDEESIKERAKEIYEKYILADAPYELNLSYRLRQEAKDKLSTPDKDMFNNVQKETFVLMVHGVFDLFLKSETYQSFRDARNKVETARMKISHEESSSCCTLF